MNPIAEWQRNRRRTRARKRLDSIQVAKPCTASWEAMEGDEKVRFCGQCRLHVFNLSAMDVEEAAALIAQKDGRLCVRFYRRRDGTTLTQDCPVGVAAWRKRLRVMWASAAGAFAALFGAASWALNASTMTQGAPIGRVSADAVVGMRRGPEPAKPDVKPDAEPTMGLP